MSLGTKSNAGPLLSQDGENLRCRVQRRSQVEDVRDVLRGQRGPSMRGMHCDTLRGIVRVSVLYHMDTLGGPLVWVLPSLDFERAAFLAGACVFALFLGVDIGVPPVLILPALLTLPNDSFGSGLRGFYVLPDDGIAIPSGVRLQSLLRVLPTGVIGLLERRTKGLKMS